MHMDVCSKCLRSVQEQQLRGSCPEASAACPMCRAAIRSVLPLPICSEERY